MMCGAMAALGEQCSMTERRADDATREVDAWLKCEFLKDRIGEEFEGVIAAVTNFGVFVELSDLYIEGLIHISALPGDYYHFDQAKQRLIGERTRQVFQLGGAVTVRVARVDLDDRKIDLELAGVAPSRRVRVGSAGPRVSQQRGAATRNRAGRQTAPNGERKAVVESARRASVLRSHQNLQNPPSRRSQKKPLPQAELRKHPSRARHRPQSDGLVSSPLLAKKGGEP
jgi:ribonuclease R